MGLFYPRRNVLLFVYLSTWKMWATAQNSLILPHDNVSRGTAARNWQINIGTMIISAFRSMARRQAGFCSRLNKLTNFQWFSAPFLFFVSDLEEDKRIWRWEAENCSCTNRSDCKYELSDALKESWPNTNKFIRVIVSLTTLRERRLCHCPFRRRNKNHIWICDLHL